MSLETKLKTLNQKQLLVFDFDETIVDCNSDSWIHQLGKDSKIPDNLQYSFGKDYFSHVQSVLAHLFSLGIKESDYAACLSDMPVVPGVIEPLIKSIGLEKDKFDIIILSDSNSFFINSYLKSKGIDQLIYGVLTNPAIFTSDGELMINEYHIQDYCALSSKNLCKGEALKNFIGKMMLDHNTVYTCVNYIGDGENDLCPSSKLSPRDRIFPRQGYTLHKLCDKSRRLHTCPGLGTESSILPNIQAHVYPWANGQEILDTITGVASAIV